METQELIKLQTVTKEVEVYTIILYNDEVNTFDWVIECLVEICEHTIEQAEQCAIIVHNKGRYGVQSGSFDFLKPRYNALAERGLSVKIE